MTFARKGPLAYLTSFLVFAFLFFAFYFFYQETPLHALTNKAELISQYSKLPLLFEKNMGQANSEVSYLTRGTGYQCFFTPNEVVIALLSKQSTAATSIRMQFVDHQSSPVIRGLEEQIAKSNYFIGNDPSQWHTNVPNYAKVLYENIYPGINAIFYGNPQQLEYDFNIAPGSSPDQLRLHIEGSSELSIDLLGNLHVNGSDQQEITMHKPIIYQFINNEKKFIDGSFILLANNTVGFSIHEYDLTKELVIDPVLSYSTFLGGSAFDQISDVTVDTLGNAYVTGSTASANFPTTAGVVQPAIAGGIDAFITKFNSTGTAQIYSTYLGGTGSDGGSSIAIDSANNAYICGSTNSVNFPTTGGAFQPALAGSSNAFITQLNSTGTALVYSTYLGGSGNDAGNSIALDSANNAYVTGRTTSADFPTTLGAFQTTTVAAQTAFVTQLNSTGTALVYSTYLGGSSFEIGSGITLDSSNNAYVTGNTASSDFPTTPGAFQTNLLGAGAAFVTKFNPTGTAQVYSTYLGGSANQRGFGIALDSSANAYVTGFTSSADFPVTPGAFQTTLNDSQSTFVTKFNPTGTAQIYSTFLGGSDPAGFSNGSSIAVDSNGNAYVTGDTGSSDFPTTPGAFQTTLPSTDAAYVTKFNSTGSALIYSTYLGGSTGDVGSSIFVDNVGNAYVGGLTDSSDFPVTSGAFQTLFGGSTDGFLTKFNLANPSLISISPHSGPVAGGTVVTITGTNLSLALSVQFGTVPAASFTIDSDTQITAISPPGTGTVDVTVTTPGGTTPTTPEDLFTYISVLPPSNLRAVAACNKFLLQTEFINVLRWSPPTSGADPVEYRIYRDANLTRLIAVVPATRPLLFVDHNRIPGKKYTYYIISIDDTGFVSSTVSVSVRSKC